MFDNKNIHENGEREREREGKDGMGWGYFD